MFLSVPYVSEKVWGYERWIASAHAVGNSTADKSALPEYAGKTLGEITGGDFPLLVKLIQANDTLSVQVHPDDEYARRVENTYGKTECWYILDAVPGATLVCGLNKEYTKGELEAALNGGTLADCLKYVPVSKGDFVFIPAGTVHAIQGGLRLLEVQEPSDITYRLYDWGRPREIHVAKALEVTKCSAPEPVRNFSGVFSCDYFRLEKCVVCAGASCGASLSVADGVSSGAGDTHNGIIAEPVVQLPGKRKEASAVLFILEGEGTLSSSRGNSLSVKPEDTVILSADEDVTVSPAVGKSLSYMKITIPM
ncbi:MAG: class I mannose-6-phosphate isomerase [Treponemataceae bacterium]|nr:class I mannose-6-phosphate isomerase [Treponemataceae bacterium]